VPGRGEHIRLALEEAGAEYTDTAQVQNGVQTVLTHTSDQSTGDAANPPTLAPPILKHGDLVISQTSNILLYLAPLLRLAPAVDDDDDDPNAIYHINALVLTALDGLSNEPHDCHHPIATGLFYDDQKPEASRRAADYISTRLPRFLGYFQRVLTANNAAADAANWLYKGSFTYADLVLFQCLDGVKHAFPKAMASLQTENKYKAVFDLYENVRERPRIKAYLASERRQKYGMGIYRYYPELDIPS
jgi:glutathione S-transferase